MYSKFQLPIRFIISAPSQGGKSFYVGQILGDRGSYFNSEFEKIYYCCDYETSIPEQIADDPKLVFHQGLPNEEFMLAERDENILIVLDDMMETVFQSETVSKIFTAGRHRKISAIILTQNLFPPFKFSRSISLNASHIFIFRNCRDMNSFSHLIRQILPSNQCKSFIELYNKNIDQAYRHLMIDFTPEQLSCFRFRENVISNRFPIYYTNESDIKRSNAEVGTFEEIPFFVIKL